MVVEHELYCTYFDHNYLRKGLALYLSLRAQSRQKTAVLAVLALSKICENTLKQLNLPNLIIIPVEKLEINTPRLLNAKNNRSTVEYYFTLTPWLIQQSLEICPWAKRATYLDSDLYFFDDPCTLWEEIGESAMAFVEHRFANGYTDKICYGKFNVGWNTFSRQPIAKDALHWWAESCLEWCYDRIEGAKFADQGYLTTLETQFGNVHTVKYPGINLAEYNLDNYWLELTRNKPYANGLPVIYWHLHCLFEKENGDFSVLLREDLLSHPVIYWAYETYINKIRRIEAGLTRLNIRIDKGNARYPQLQQG